MVIDSLVGILSVPDAFLEFRDFRMALISLVVILEPQLEEGIEMELDCKFLFLRIFTMRGWFLYLSKIDLKSPFLLLDPISNSTSSDSYWRISLPYCYCMIIVTEHIFIFMDFSCIEIFTEHLGWIYWDRVNVDTGRMCMFLDFNGIERAIIFLGLC